MSFFKRRRNWGMLLLGIWLIATGAVQLGLAVPHIGYVLAMLAIVAGVLILLDR